MVTLVLEREGLTVATAESGKEAIRIFHERGIDLLVTDIKMPEMDGCTLAIELQKANPSLPVLLMSGFCEEEPDEVRCRFPLLAKPFSIAALVGKVRELLSKAAAASPDMAPSLT
jgi:DNA-binding response OmpR family regulator